ncbi:MAG: Dna2/Cas4 domain-containing protein [Candidatus Poseidoniaceae archaeon]|jgi:CRISPR-associated exonuclease Cas4|nr:Dna2/Cas4 domain-containing protein [Candidatus Poseidoniaceae archaeon]
MTTDNESPLHHAEESDDGFWRNSDEEALHVSASDLERHAYCPLSWQLARKGKPGRGEAVQAGRVAHAEIHRRVEDFKNKQFDLRRALVIWSWWFTIILVIIADCIIFSVLDDEIRPPIDMAKFLTMLAVSWLGVGLLAIYFPWRQWINFPTDVEKYKSKIENMNEIVIESTLQPPGFIGGWSQGGRVEAGLLLGAITFGIHAIGLTWAENKENAAFILIIMATFWTLLASWQLQKALLADNALEIARLEAGLENNVDVAYSDDESTAGLLVDNETGLRGRPDQIVIVDGEFIPVEQKTGKIPNQPHKSHEIQLLAYISLVASTTGRAPPYGVLRYGPESIHTIQWNEKSRSRLMASTKEIQRLMVQGGAERNHNRKGKCANCSRRYACDSSLV